jgi:hypothetical protein
MDTAHYGVLNRTTITKKRSARLAAGASLDCAQLLSVHSPGPILLDD